MANPRYNLNDPNNPRHQDAGYPGVPMVYQPAKLDKLYDAELAARLAREYTVECIERLAEHMRDPTEPQVSLAATNMLLDRGYGKPGAATKPLLANGADNVPQYRIKVEFVDNVIDNMPKAERPVPQPVFEE